ncbi:dual specificity protein phosphatase family protein [Kutzneria viridogrisea]|uniref:Tyrosine specific protein phosphatases domain-containing protein n=2 Tax=Kutzneria TaxID=43356 RepID=W5WJI6_9PSEU|nr:hypothetical protein [Kutzneria albida]AHI00727.1 hypothetical protein KALB_7369 [Kutzneria albida DSM 43870]MBA8926000.1 hypothetical protein [Kutzneria viridogrisea]
MPEPGPEKPFSLIRTDLWMGGHERYDESGELVPVRVEREFDLVVSLWAGEGFGPAPGVEHWVLRIPDGELTAEEVTRVGELSAATAEALRAGRRTFVRCHFGYNRSGLVAAQALVLLGHGVDEAIDLVRLGRSRHALNNQHFLGYLRHDLARHTNR